MSDILVREVFDGLEKDIRAGLIIYLALGTPCSSWSILSRRNNTRTQELPGGTGCDEKERIANEQAIATARLCQLITLYGGFFSIENPKTSLLFRFEPIARLFELSNARLVSFDQCAYGLQLPGSRSHEFCKKATSILTNVEALDSLERRCPGRSPHHVHQYAQGSIKVNGKSASASAAAGAYPPKLCAAWAQAVCVTLHSL